MEAFSFMDLSHMAEKLNILSGIAFFCLLGAIQLLRNVYRILTKSDTAA